MNDLEQSLTNKADLLHELLAETQKQGELVVKGDMEALALSLDVRQALMDSIDALDGCIRDMGSQTHGTAVDSLRADIVTLLQSIMDKDADNRLHAGEMTSKHMAGMKEVKAEKKIMAYMNNESPGSKFINREG